jgi:hypothetical protein
MAIAAVLIKQPYSVSFTGNAMPYLFAVQPYGTVEKQQDIRLQVKVMVEAAANVWDEVFNQQYYPNDAGTVLVDVAQVLAPYLQYFTPPPFLQKPVLASGHRKKYRVDYLLIQDNNIVQALQSTPDAIAIKGGMAMEHWHSSEFFTDVIAGQKKALLYGSTSTGIDELRFLYWIYPYADNSPQTVYIDVLLNNGTVLYESLADVVTAPLWGVCCCPAGFTQLNLGALVPDVEEIVSYTIRVDNAAALNAVAPVTYTLNHRYFKQPVTLLYRNSAGGIDTQRLLGQVDFKTEIALTNAQRSLTPDYLQNSIMDAELTQPDTEETVLQEGHTGFINRPQAQALRDLFLAPQKWELYNNTLLPIAWDGKNIAFYNNADNLISIAIAWRRAFTNNFFTPNGIMPVARACPALESFAAIQLNKNTLQISWAAPLPYNAVQVTIIAGSITATVVYYSNYGTIRQLFTNPAALGSTASISVAGRCICNEYTNPMEVGPASTISLTVSGNLAPVANDDTYVLATGLTSPITLTGSVISNDYDPDGDPLTVTAVTGGTTHDGGTYSINAAGVVTYQPVSLTYSGQDYFDYTVSDGTLTDTGRVFINVGTVDPNVYAKIVQRNVVVLSGTYSSHIQGEVWIDYFADAAGTVPIDVTSRSLTVNWRQNEYTQDFWGATNSTDTDYTLAAAGTKQQLYNGFLYADYYDPSYSYNDVQQLTFFVLPGTGYIVI